MICEESSALDLGYARWVGQRSIQSVLVEGDYFSRACLKRAWLTKSFFVAPIIIGSQDAPSVLAAGRWKVAEAPQLEHVGVGRHGRDVEITGCEAKDEG